VITEILIMFVWVMASGFYALAVDRRLAPGAVGYLAAFALAVWRPEWRYPIMAVANGLYSVQAMVHWRRAIRT